MPHPKGVGCKTLHLDAILSKRSELFGQPCRGAGESPRSSSGEGQPLPGPLEERPHPHRDSNRLSQVCATTQVPGTPTQRGPQGMSPEDNLGAETHDDLHTVTGPQPWKGKVMKWGNRSWRLRAGQSGIRTVVLNPGEGLRSIQSRCYLAAGSGPVLAPRRTQVRRSKGWRLQCWPQCSVGLINPTRF